MPEQLTDKRVLIVDDDESIRDFLTLLFEGAGYEVRTAASAERALEALAEQHDPVIMLDIMMPGMTGLEALGKLKEISPDSSVIMLTAHADRDSAITALNLGAYKFFVKPLAPESHPEVIEAANAAVARYQAALAAQEEAAARRVRRRRVGLGVAIGVPVAAVLVALGVALHVFQARKQAAMREPLGESQRHSILITFGVKDVEPTAWNGNLALSDGYIESLQGWCFSERDSIISNNAWECSTEEAVKKSPVAPEGAKEIMRKGIILSVSAPARATVMLMTNRGDTSFALSKVLPGKRLVRAGGQIWVERTAWSELITDDTREDDFPSIASAPDGNLWVAWLSHGTRADEIRLRRFDGNVWSAVMKVVDEAGDYHNPNVAVAGDGRVWVIWGASENGNWDLFARSYDGRAWSEVKRLTRSAFPDINPRVTADRLGRLWLVWQGFRQGNSDIYMRCLADNVWSDIIRVTDDLANDWEPAIAADVDGDVYIAWDTYRNGDYDVFMRKYSNGELETEIPIATSPNFEAHASVACDGQGRVWVAWNEAGPNWGKDYPGGIGTRLYDVRKVRVACYTGEELARTSGTLRTRLFSQVTGGRDIPYVVVDGTDRPWLFFRHKQERSFKLPDGRIASQALWGVYGTYYDGENWAAPIFLPNSFGHNDQRLSACFTRGGDICVAYAGDGRTYRSPEPFNNQVYVGRLRVPPGVAAEPGFAAPAPDREPRAVPPKRVPQKAVYETTIGDRTYKLLWGDLHRHTDISWDGADDGSLQDMYRYAMDAAELDFVATTDHEAGQGRRYPWWRTQKYADLYEIRGRFTPLYAYERSVRYPFGHRNVIQPVRGIRPVPVFRDVHGLKGLAADDTARLWAALMPSQNVVIPHSSATNMGTNWSADNREMETLVELHQGARASYECKGGPRALEEGSEEAARNGYAPDGFVWNALAKGYRLGFISSSDHGSSHVGFAAVYAENRTRQAIFEALKKRRTYAATDFIILDVRMGNHLMGEEFDAPSVAALAIKARGMHDLMRVDVVKDNAVIYTKTCEGKRVEFEFMDAQPTPGPSYYYARVIQHDPNYRDKMQIAWSSPIWVTLTR